MSRRLYQRVAQKLFDSIRRRADNGSPLLPYVDHTALLPREELLRLGTAYGGWLIPTDAGLTSDSMCYSVGAGEDISFDCALVERFHCQIRIMDPTPRAIEHFHQLSHAVGCGSPFPINNSKSDYYAITAEDFERIQFLPIGLADRDAELKFFFPKDPQHVSCSTVNLQKTDQYFTAKCHRLSSIMKQQGDASIDLLKIDIEGAEYAVITDIVEADLLPRLLLIEFDEVHDPQDSEAYGRVKRHIELLVQAGMRCIAVEGSNATLRREL